LGQPARDSRRRSTWTLPLVDHQPINGTSSRRLSLPTLQLAPVVRHLQGFVPIRPTLEAQGA